MGSSKIAKANPVDDPYYKIQLKAKLRIDFFYIKDISSSTKVDNYIE